MSKNHLIQSAAAQLLVQQAFTPTPINAETQVGTPPTLEYHDEVSSFVTQKHEGRVKPHSNRHKRLRAAVFQFAVEYALSHQMTVPTLQYRRHRATGVVTVDTHSMRGGILAAKREVRQRKLAV